MKTVSLMLAIAIATAHVPTDAQTTLSAQSKALHALNRLTFGPRPGEVERVAALGVDRWIALQLQPEAITDTTGARALEGCGAWTMPLEEARASLKNSINLTLVHRDSLRKLQSPSLTFQFNAMLSCRLARMEASDQQLVEAMTNFWENHFSVYRGNMLSRFAVLEWDRAVLRPHALGRFRDLLGAVAKSPTMLHYLDNEMNRAPPDQPVLQPGESGVGSDVPSIIPVQEATGLNENYARELLELHTLGVDGGYTQADVIQVARAFTGWTHTRRGRGNFVAGSRDRETGMMLNTSAADARFVFDSTWHDAASKTVLGHRLAPGGGIEDGEQVLDILAAHPSTARFIARKLAVRFVSDAPPNTLVERAAHTYLRTNGDIREVMRTIVTSPEFFAPSSFHAKVKSPLELLLSTRRALAAPIDRVAENIDVLIALDQSPFGYLTPDGWPETAAGWMNEGAVIKRLSFGLSVARNELPTIPLEAWPHWNTLSTQPFEQQLSGVIRTLLHGRASPQLRAAMLAAKPKPPVDVVAREQALRQVVALALGSPEFQRR